MLNGRSGDELKGPPLEHAGDSQPPLVLGFACCLLLMSIENKAGLGKLSPVRPSSISFKVNLPLHTIQAEIQTICFFWLIFPLVVHTGCTLGGD